MNYPTTQVWRNALAKIATEKLPGYIVKTPTLFEDTIDIFLPDQDQNLQPFMSIEAEPAGKSKRDHIKLFISGYRSYRDYKTDEQFARNIAKAVADVRAGK
jgi:hypothetical protein